MAAAGWGRGYRRRRGQLCCCHDRAGLGARRGVRGGGILCLRLCLSRIFSRQPPLPAARATMTWRTQPGERLQLIGCHGCSSVTWSSVVLKTKNPSRLPDKPCAVRGARCWLHNTASFRNRIFEPEKWWLGPQHAGFVYHGPTGQLCVANTGTTLGLCQQQ